MESPLAQALPYLSTGACLTVVFLTASEGFLLGSLFCLHMGPCLTVVFLTFSVLAQGGLGVMVQLLVTRFEIVFVWW